MRREENSRWLSEFLTMSPSVPLSRFQATQSPAYPTLRGLHLSFQFPSGSLHQVFGEKPSSEAGNPLLPPLPLISLTSLPNADSSNIRSKRKRAGTNSRSIGISMAPPGLRRKRMRAVWTQGSACCLSILSTGPCSQLPSPRALDALCRSTGAFQTVLS